jgi:hypothetical protein
MNREMHELLGILQREISLHRALETELGNEAALDGKLTGGELLRIQARKNQCVRAIRGLESQRILLVTNLGLGLGGSKAPPSLREIAARADGDLRAALLRSHQELLDLIGRIRALALVTSQNAQARLKAIDATLHVVREALKMHPIYSEEGRLHKQTPTLKSTSA